MSLSKVIRRPPRQRDRLAVRTYARLRGVGVFVIVVGNYLCAAFYEASGASACHSGFHILVETSAPPVMKIYLYDHELAIPLPQVKMGQ